MIRQVARAPFRVAKGLCGGRLLGNLRGEGAEIQLMRLRMVKRMLGRVGDTR